MSDTRNDGNPPQPGLSRSEQRRVWAAEGNVDALWDAFVNSRIGLSDFGEMTGLLQHAIEKRAQDAPDHFADDMHRRMVSLISFLVLKAHWQITKQIRYSDQSAGQRGDVSDSAEALRLMPHLFALQEHLVALQQGHASTQRLRELTRATRLANERNECKKRSSRKGRTVPPLRHAALSPENRLAGVLEN